MSHYRINQLVSTYTMNEIAHFYRIAKREGEAGAALDSPDVGTWQELATLYHKAWERRRWLDLKGLPVADGKRVGRVVVDIDTLKMRCDLVEIAGRHVELRKTGRAFKGLCPFHNEKTPSFHVFPEDQHYHCFSCEAHGDVIDFISRIRGLDLTQTLQVLAAEAGIDYPPPKRRDSRWGVEV